MSNKFYSLPKSVFEHYHAKIKDWVRAVLPTKTSDLTNDSDFLDQLALAGIIASNFSTSSTYAVGDYVLYNHTLYRCKTAISTAGAWDASKWDDTKTQDIFQGSAPGLVPSAESGDADKVLKGDGTWGEAGSSVRVSYDAQTEELHMDFGPPPADSVLIGNRYYHYVKIGNQLWIDEDLEYLPSGLTLGTDAFYYNNVRQDKHGLLYKPIACFNAIENSLPNGWRIATKSDVIALVNTVGSNNASKLRATSEWVGTVTQSTDEYGLSILPTGYWWSDQGFIYGGSRFTCWTSTRASESATSGWCRLFIDHSNSINILDSGMYDDTGAYPIRLVKDA